MTAPVAPAVAASVPTAVPASPALDTDDLLALRAAIDGTVLAPGDDGFEAGRLAHNTLFVRRPAVIVRPANALDVARAVRTARELDLEIAVRGGGHSVAGHSTTEDGMLIDLGAMTEVDIDPIRWTGTAQGGTTAGAYTMAAAQHGFATPFGDSASVGLGGLTLGGGIGWLTRKHGMTIDNLLAVDLVTADGELRTVTEASDPDLFWALRGGGGNFGIATRFTYRLHPVSTVTGGALVLPLAADVLQGVVEASLEAPDELTQITMIMRLPPAPFVPEALVGTPVIMVMPVHAGDPEAGAAAMAPFRALATPLMDMVGPMPYAGMYQLTAGGAEPGPAITRSAFLSGLDRAAAEAIVERHLSPAGAAAMSQVRVLGGAMGRVPAGATAFAHREAPLMATVMAFPVDGYEEAAAFADGFLADLAGAATGVYSNFLADEAGRLHEAYPGSTYERLVAVKRRVDPQNLFRANHNVRP
jgi:FAD/FMN-containing dehydrogenase